MKFTETPLKGAFVIELEKREDERGFFARTFCQQEFAPYNLKSNIKQANASRSVKKGTLRGMHYQLPPHAETKLVSCARGALYDVTIDLRPDSPTYKQWFGIELTQDNGKMLYVPERFAHGFLTLTDNTEAMYLVTEFYTPEAERGIRYNDPQFAIDWPISVESVSEKDAAHPDYKEDQA